MKFALFSNFIQSQVRAVLICRVSRNTQLRENRYPGYQLRRAERPATAGQPNDCLSCDAGWFAGSELSKARVFMSLGDHAIGGKTYCLRRY